MKNHYKAEKAKSKELTQQNEELLTRVAALETEVIDRTGVIEIMNDEKARAEADLQSVMGSRDELLQSYERLKISKEDTEMNAEERIRTANSEWDKLELNLRADLCTRDEKLEEQFATISAIQGEIESLKFASREAEATNLRLESTNSSLTAGLEELQKRHAAQTSTLSETKVSLDCLITENSKLCDVARISREELEHARSELDGLKHKHEGEIFVLHNELIDQKSNESNLKDRLETALKTSSDLNEQLNSVAGEVQHLNQLREKSHEEIQRKDSKILLQQEKIEHYLVKCSDQQAELAELQDLKERLMSVIGGHSNIFTDPSSRTRKTVRSTNARKPVRRNSVETDTTRKEIVPDDERKSFGSVTSAKSASRTPKRVKIKAFKAPAFQQPHTRAAITSKAKSHRRSNSAFERTPLMDLDIDLVNQTSGLKTTPTRSDARPSTANRSLCLRARREIPGMIADITQPDDLYDDDSFDASCLMTSTQMPNLPDESRHSHILDETRSEC